ncbi:cytosolic sulfotransferase 17-like [Macadamia integrifolia]|uniref:cytosolic sulfotransferase 17-like n=1 Tax=Macadamia integrifolia TaxID=60698 RepID=UPI001C4F9C33|nr:cytosolic sulfotransferase 17-like [Macadamia integrifolia]
MAIQDHFKARSTDIFFAATPNYGTKWIEALLISTVTPRMYSKHNNPLIPSNVPYLFPSLDLMVYNKRIFPNLEIIPSPRLLGVHIPYSLLQPSVIKSSCRIVYVCRNPKDVFVSFWNFTNRLRDQISKPPLTAVDAIERFCKGSSHFGPFWDHVLGYWKASLESPEQVLFLKFEQMKAYPTPYLKREGKVGDLENHVTSEMIERLDQITEEKFRGSGVEL